MYRISICLKPICDASLIEMLTDNGFAIYKVNPVTNHYSHPFDDQAEENDHLPSYYQCMYDGEAPANLQIILAVLNGNPSVSKIKLEITTE